jgi:transposase-like protein
MDLIMPKPPATEVIAEPRYDRRQRRRFSGEEKLRILREAKACTERGELTALLRREGLYSSHLTQWRAQFQRLGLEGLAPKKAGRKPAIDAKDRKIVELERRNAKLAKRLDLAEKVIDLQRKAHEILGVALPRVEED